MKLPRAVSGADVISALEKCGFKVLRQAGSHVRLGKDAVRLTVPLHPSVAPGTLRNILRQSQLSVDAFISALPYHGSIRRTLFALTLIAATASLSAQPTPKTQFVQVEPDVRLEVLDWGGRGRAVVLLAGGGDTAHVYEELARKLTPAYHVVGITRRGFGASSRPPTGYSSTSLGDDILRVLDALKIDKPVLIGHSVAGDEMSSIGARRSDRIAGIIYLDAATDRTYVLPPDQKCGADCDMLGIGDAPKPDPKHFDPRTALGAGVERPNYARIRVPALALYAAPRTWSEMMPGAPKLTDPKQQAAAKRVVALAARTRKYHEDAFRSGVKNSRVVEIPGASHYIFRSNEADVLREIRAFLKALP